jgi:hypothetical protein
MSDLVDRDKKIWLTENEVRESIKDLLNHCKNKRTNNLKYSMLTLELFLQMNPEQKGNLA